MRSGIFEGADFTGADLRNADVGRACFVGARLDDADLRAIDVAEANLKGARANGATKWPADFDPIAHGVLVQSSFVQSGARQELTAVVGEDLSAVTFVRDYLQLHFDGPFINAFTLPTVTARGVLFSERSPGYRDALCERIGVRVIAAYVVPEDRLQIDFADGSCISISLRAEDRVVAEAALYQDPSTQEWACW